MSSGEHSSSPQSQSQALKSMRTMAPKVPGLPSHYIYTQGQALGLDFQLLLLVKVYLPCAIHHIADTSLPCAGSAIELSSPGADHREQNGLHRGLLGQLHSLDSFQTLSQGVV